MTSKSRQYCCVPQCRNYAGKNVSIHVFPKDERMREKWQVALKIGKPISKYMVVCGEHFKPADFFPSSQMKIRHKLKKGVIPSQKIPLDNFPDENQKERKSRKMLLMETDESTSEILFPQNPNLPEMSRAQVETEVAEIFKNGKISEVPIAPLSTETIYVEGRPSSRQSESNEQDSDTVDLFDESQPSPEITSPSHPLSDDSPQNVELRRQISKISSVNVRQAKQIRYLQKKTWSQQQRISKLTSLVSELRDALLKKNLTDVDYNTKKKRRQSI